MIESSVERKEPPKLMEEFRNEVRDMSGELRFTLVSGKDTSGRLCNLSIEAGGKTVDIFDIIGLSSDEYSVNIADTGDFHAPQNKKEVNIPEQRSLLTFLIALHEFGHVIQRREKKYLRVKDAVNGYTMKPVIEVIRPELELLEAMDADLGIPPDDRNKLFAISDEYSPLYEENQALIRRTREELDEFEKYFFAFVRLHFPNSFHQVIKRAMDPVITGDGRNPAVKNIHTALQEILQDQGLLDDATRERIAVMYEPRIVPLDTARAIIDDQNRRLRNLQVKFDGIFSPYSEGFAEKVDSAYMSGTAILERDATRRAFAWIRKLESMLGEKILFDFSVEEIGDVGIDIAKIDRPNVIEELTNGRYKGDEPLRNVIISPREAMRLPLMAYHADSKTVRERRRLAKLAFS